MACLPPELLYEIYKNIKLTQDKLRFICCSHYTLSLLTNEDIETLRIYTATGKVLKISRAIRLTQINANIEIDNILSEMYEQPDIFELGVDPYTNPNVYPYYHRINVIRDKKHNKISEYSNTFNYCYCGKNIKHSHFNKHIKTINHITPIFQQFIYAKKIPVDDMTFEDENYTYEYLLYEIIDSGIIDRTGLKYISDLLDTLPNYDD